jgi:hypothetical protein
MKVKVVSCLQGSCETIFSSVFVQNLSADQSSVEDDKAAEGSKDNNPFFDDLDDSGDEAEETQPSDLQYLAQNGF